MKNNLVVFVLSDNLKRREYILKKSKVLKKIRGNLTKNYVYNIKLLKSVFCKIVWKKYLKKIVIY